MLKKYIVRFSDQERTQLASIVKELSGSSQKVRRAQILLKSDADGPAWTDAKIAKHLIVEPRPLRIFDNGSSNTAFAKPDGKKRSSPPTLKMLNGE